MIQDLQSWCIKVDCSLLSIFSYFYLTVERADRITRELDTSAKDETSHGRGCGPRKEEGLKRWCRWQQRNNRGRSLMSPLFSKDVYSISISHLAQFAHLPNPTCFALTSLTFSFVCIQIHRGCEQFSIQGTVEPRVDSSGPLRHHDLSDLDPDHSKGKQP